MILVSAKLRIGEKVRKFLKKIQKVNAIMQTKKWLNQRKPESLNKEIIRTNLKENKEAPNTEYDIKSNTTAVNIYLYIFIFKILNC